MSRLDLLEEALSAAPSGDGLVYLHPTPGRAGFVLAAEGRLQRELGRTPWAGRVCTDEVLEEPDSFVRARQVALAKGAGGVVRLKLLDESYLLMTLQRFERLMGGDPGHDDDFPHRHVYAE